MLYDPRDVHMIAEQANAVAQSEAVQSDEELRDVTIETLQDVRSTLMAKRAAIIDQVIDAFVEAFHVRLRL